MTILLAVVALSLIVLVFALLVTLGFRAARVAVPQYMKEIMMYSGVMIYLTGLFAYGLYADVYYAGFKETSRIQDAPAWIIQFHCYCQYDQRRADQVFFMAQAMDALS